MSCSLHYFEFILVQDLLPILYPSHNVNITYRWDGFNHSTSYIMFWFFCHAQQPNNEKEAMQNITAHTFREMAREKYRHDFCCPIAQHTC